MQSNKQYKLIVTMKEERYKKDRDYLSALQETADLQDIKCMLGGINTKYNFFGDAGEGYTGESFELKDLFGVSDLVITTSVLEGFGYCFAGA